MRGNEYRTMSPTEANATSSRSHAVLQINVSQKDRNADVNEPHTMATLSIIDLAGSERASATKNRGERLLEGANINKSLLALGSCINALCDPHKKNHVPYRNSKLTRLLKFSLGGNCKTVMIVCVSPSSQHFDETQNTLRYANRAKNIQTKVTRNVYNVNRHVKDFLKKIDEQMALINELKQQQKDHEGVAYVKFKKQCEKREVIAREGVARIRSAYENSATERQEKMGNMRKLRQIERRIAMISSWVAAFDNVCDSREEERPPKNLLAMRKTAQGILVELEGSRQHYHHRLAKGNWERAVDSALQNSVRQLKDADGGTDGSDVASLTREAELLKANAEREGLMGIIQQEKAGDAALVQVLLNAHFETIQSINDILAMDEEEAVEAAKHILSKILNACSNATSQVIKPDGALAANELFPPTRSGTPKRRKQAPAAGIEPVKAMMPAVLAVAPHLAPSPVRGSPKRRKNGAAKKGVSFTPKKKSPIKGLKRGVRWRDDTEDGTLAEFEKTPQRQDSTPTTAIDQPVVDIIPPSPLQKVILASDLNGSSPIPTPPEPSLDLKPKTNRFKTGFLAKRTDGSPLPPQFAGLSSDSDQSPLRNIEPNKASNRSSLNAVELSSHEAPPNDPGSTSSSDADDKPWKADKTDAARIKTAIKRASMSNATSTGTQNARPQRRRSPTGAVASSGSPPNNDNALFTASHARRMVRNEKENDWRGNNVLSPRTAPVVKVNPQRRTTMQEGKFPKDTAAGLSGREAVRLSTAVVTGSGGAGGGGAARGSLMVGGKNVWR